MDEGGENSYKYSQYPSPLHHLPSSKAELNLIVVVGDDMIIMRLLLVRRWENLRHDEQSLIEAVIFTISSYFRPGFSFPFGNEKNIPNDICCSGRRWRWWWDEQVGCSKRRTITATLGKQLGSLGSTLLEYSATMVTLAACRRRI